MSPQARLVAGRFRTIRRLGAGAMASVFLAEDCELGRMVAIKRLHPESSPEVAPRFRREMRVAASLSHPHIVTLYDAIVEDEAVLLVMEYVEGPTLAERLREGPMDAHDALELLRDLADAIDYLHRQGIIHRDIKPANVLLDSGGRVKLTDLGIASAAQATGITTEGTLLGTPAYMAPELFEGRPSTSAADVYSLGALSYELLTGRRAREGGTPVVIALRAASEEPPDLRELRPDAPALADALQRGMARRPEDRPPTATALVDQIAAALERDGAPPAPPATADIPTAPAPQHVTEVNVAPAAERRAAREPAPAARPPRREASGAAASSPAAAREAPRGAQRPGRAGGKGARGLVAAALALVAAAVAAVVVAGTGSDDPAQRTGASTAKERQATTSGRRTTTTGGGSAAPSTTAAPSTASTSTAAPAAPAAGASGQTPESAVQSFYGLAAAHRYDEAWALAAPSLRTQLGGFGSFRSQFSTVRSIRFRRAETVQRGADAATVAIATTATHTDHVDRCTGTAQTTPGSDGGWLVSHLTVRC